MTKYKVTKAGTAALCRGIKLTSEVIELTNGSSGIAWTKQATCTGTPPIDSEGWAPWCTGEDRCSIAGAITKGFVEVIHDED